MAFARDCRLVEELAVRLGRVADARRMRAWHGEMKTAINRHAWDGDWYVCALDDDGRPVGSHRNRQGRLFLNMQSWAQLGRVCDEARWARAWASVRRHLDTGWGFKLNWPAYLKPEPNVGRMSYMRPGICENACVYTHGNAFMLMALLERGLADEALALLRAIDPVNPRRPCVNQPNLYFNGCLGPDAITDVGHAEHVWCTGSAAWIYLAVTEFVLGLRRTFDGLVVRPCFPSAWATAAVSRTFRGTTYHVTIRNPHRAANAPVASLRIDGRPHDPARPLPLDGGTHEVRVRLGPVPRTAARRKDTR
ncbi:MAG: N,N'-diacetylchitobiose phosphorylase [Lentisphaerae bacterium ADurb.BinA184]|nr:MAG: N,N'-diacetylchitobiose phosphorylase [Lentisphaerae bacterium ADurb.BinA184]